jgi:sugar phosphate isomerase/epimerase
MLQLKKSIRLDCLQQPLKTALTTAARIGAEGVEINGRTELRPADMSRTAVRHFRKILADLKLKVSAIHFPTRRGYGIADDLERRIEATKAAMTMAYELGSNVVINDIGSIAEDEEADSWKTLVEALTDIGNHGQRAGAWLAAQTGTAVGNGESLKRLIDSLATQSLFIDFDPASFVISENSPTDAMDLLGEHVVNLRARDAVRDLSAGRALEVQLGRGSVDWASLLGTLEQQNFQGFITVDRDAESDAAEQCAMGMEFLTNLFR